MRWQRKPLPTLDFYGIIGYSHDIGSESVRLKTMNSVVEKLAAIEQEIAALQPKMAPLTERIADLDQKVTGFAHQLNDLAAESAAVKQDIELTRNGLVRIQTLIGESKTESEQLAAGQEENQQRYKAMESFVGTLYQLHSQSVQIAQWLGLADQAKAVFPAPPSTPATLAPIASPVTPVAELPEPPAFVPDLPLPEAVAEPLPPELPVTPVAELPEPPAFVPDLPLPEATTEPLPPELPVPEAVAEPIPVESPMSESELSESDFDAAISDVGTMKPEPLGVPGLPNVAAPPEMGATPSDSDSDSDDAISDAEPSDEIASHLDVPPLHLATPPLPEQTEAAPADEKDDQDIEAMLAAMGAPVVVGS